ncbi:MAG: lipopolysaccharide heptosyltransferase family protein [Acidobacteria bacterium]|nr:MAG: lipopolysaccharide heptosyltransferase family protein [Acidobacteriota bacterium]
MWLLYRRGGLGDTLLTFPLLELYKRYGKRAWAVGNTDYFEIAKEVGWADVVSSELPNMDFEGMTIISYDGNVEPFPKGRVWVVEHYLRSAGLEGRFSEELPLKPLKDSPLVGTAVLHPSSGSRKKNPPLELFLMVEDFLKRKGFKTIYLLGEADGHLKAHLREYWESFRPLEIGRALKGAKLFIGLDSGLSHLASYCGLPTFVFYGPTDPLVWKPIGRRVFQISLNMPCSPCFPKVCEERGCLEVVGLYRRFVELFQSLV